MCIVMANHKLDNANEIKMWDRNAEMKIMEFSGW